MSDKTSSRKGTLGRSQSTGAGPTSSVVSPRLSTQDAVPPLPPVSEIDDQFEKLLADVGAAWPQAQKETMRNLGNEQKWLLICQYNDKKRDAESTRSPTAVIKKLRESFSLAELEHLVISLTREPVSWASEFVKNEGVALLESILSKKLDAASESSSANKDENLSAITQCILAFKGLLKWEEGLQSVLQSQSSQKVTQLLVGSMKFVSTYMKINILQVLAVLCIVDVDAHRHVLECWKPNVAQLLELLSEDRQSSMELRTAAMTFINALVSADAHDELQQEMDFVSDALVEAGIKTAITRMRSLTNLPQSLELQLDIFEENHEESMPIIQNPDAVFQQLKDAVKGTPVYPQFVQVLNHLLLLRRLGRPGKISWSILDRFVQVAAISVSKDASNAVAVAKFICDKLQVSIEKGDAVDLSGLAEEAAAPAISSPPADGGPPPPPPPPGSDGGPPPPPPPPGSGDSDAGGPPPPPPPPPGFGGDAGGPPPPPPLPGGDGGPPPPPPPPGSGGPPPPPPPPGSGGPPPPPPPPGSGGPPGPPPPPGFKGPAPAAAVPKKPKIKPNQKMKQFNWTQVKYNQIKDTVWTSLDDAKVKLDAKALEEHFAAIVAVKKEGPDTATLRKKQLISVLDMKRSQNISIMLSRFGAMSNEQIRDAIIAMDSEAIPLENLQSLTQYVPLPEEVEQLKEFVNAPIDMLGKAEAFVICMMSIPMLGPKLTAWEYMRSFEGKFGAVRQSLEILTKASKEVRHSKRLHKLLEFVLALGNYMNGSTTRGEAWGFKLDSLLKMLDVKSALDPKISLMHFVAEEFEKAHDPDVADLAAEFKFLEAATHESLPMVQGDLGKLKGGINQVKTLLGNAALDEKYKATLQGFAPEAEQELTSATGVLEELVKFYKETLAFYAEDPKTEAEEFFSLMNNFVQSYDKARKDNVRRKEAADGTKKKAGPLAKKMPPGIKPENANVLENMLSELVSGEAFGQKAANARKQQRMSLLKTPTKDGPQEEKKPAIAITNAHDPQPKPAPEENKLPAFKLKTTGLRPTTEAEASDAATPKDAPAAVSSATSQSAASTSTSTTPREEHNEIQQVKLKPVTPRNDAAESSVASAPTEPASASVDAAVSRKKSPREASEDNSSSSAKKSKNRSVDSESATQSSSKKTRSSSTGASDKPRRLSEGSGAENSNADVRGRSYTVADATAPAEPADSTTTDGKQGKKDKKARPDKKGNWFTNLISKATMRGKKKKDKKEKDKVKDNADAPSNEQSSSSSAVPNTATTTQDSSKPAREETSE